MYPLVREMAATGARVRVPVAVACRVLGFSEQAYYQWLKQPVSAREVEEEHLIRVLRQLHAEDPEGGYRVLADDLHDLGYEVSERRVWRLCRVAGGGVNSSKQQATVHMPPAACRTRARPADGR